ncbi:MAG: comEA protein [Bacilli bacterium]|jgi:competence protein ComEA|nr:comEA protein [Bacilli bacterium]MCX4254648.1 helix-hairpin-helix domain-containing protein [Bacilli bacterium]
MQDVICFIKRNVRDIFLFSLILIVLGLVLYKFYFTSSQNELDSSLVVALNNEEEVLKENLEEKKAFNVDVKGAVKKPGVYMVAEEAIVNDVINLAGGFNSNAYKNGINLSKRVNDEMVIYVYTKTEIKNKDNVVTVESVNDTCKTPDYSICECIDKKESIIENGNNEGENSTNIININTANAEQLTSLTGIGEAKAKAIIEYRNVNGAFKSIDDIMEVSGIGESVFVKIKDHITI